MAQAINNSADGEWTTVTVKKGYLPPHLRAKEEAVTKPLSLNDEDDFPTLGIKSTPKPTKVNLDNPYVLNMSEDFASLGGVSNTVAGLPLKASFTQKIKNLIQSEQQNEADRAAAEERKKELEGFVALSLKFTPERYSQWNEKIAVGISKEKDYSDLTQFAVGYVPSTPYPTPIFPNLPKDNYNDNFSDIGDDLDHDYDYLSAIY